MLLPILIIVAVLVLAGGNGERPIRPGSAADYAKDACMAAFTGIGDWDKAAKSVGQGDWTLEGIPRRAAVLSWRAGDTIPLGGRTLRVVGVRDDDADRPPALVVRGLSESD